MEATRASLILRLRNASDVAAWDEFAVIYSPVIRRVALDRGLQPADSENVVQEVLLAVSRSVSQWLERQDRGSFRAWLIRIARNEAVDVLTRRPTRTIGQGGSSANARLTEFAVSGDLSHQLELEYRRTVFQWAARQVRDVVAESTWLAFHLTSVEGRSIHEVARQLNMRLGNIYIARSRVMARIKDLVQQYEADE